MTSTRLPRGLSSGGRRLWTSVTSEYELEPHELLLLEQAARTAGLVEQLQTQLDEAAPLLGAKLNPVVAELRQQRLVLARLLLALRMPVSDEEDRPSGQRRAIRGVYRLGGSWAS